MTTIKDVALRAGVTVTTVSRVLNNRGYISQETREKVYRVMKELHYQPNEIARSLTRKRSMILGTIIPSIAHPFFAELTHHIERYASDLGYKILVCNSRLEPKKEKEYIDMLKSNRVDGIFMASHTLEVDVYKRLQQPIVTFDRRIADIPYVSSDNEQGGKLAAELLLRKGCEKIALICGNLSLDLLSNRRTEAFVRELRRRSVEPVVIELGRDVFETVDYGKAVGALFDAHPDVDAIFATGDMVAMHVLKSCAQRGIGIPERVKLIGYDDIDTAALVNPGLTTIRQPLEAMAKSVVDLLDGMVAGNEVPLENVHPVTLIERETT
ncbi:LacI family DNA-binding transcriptional regulator [Paenibacillus sp.]|uniref:LacI family DNA-binding transcriptional regulator n=1 Tax=Paenibacillus sp. TaxID=58172 RepID=UPI002D600E44|nr:LacI family DNA-binding transcriptional regulator [Paenibacillus sp.]HZG58883.1 LacI family DNA-binding transcriptional regulator [Paenibacillus sp.]